MNRIPDDQGGGSAAKPLTPATRLVTGGRDPFAQHGFVNTPIYRGSTVLYRNAEDFLQRKAKFTYGTKGTPTTDSLEVAWTDLTGAAGTVLVPSGLAAISIALMCCLKSGDHLLVPDSVYRPTRNFCDSVLKRFGVETTYYDPLLGADIAREFKPNTRAVFTEAPGSLSFEMQDIPAIAAAAHARDLDRADGQHLGDAAVLQLARQGRRYRDRRRHEISERRFRPAARSRLGERALLEGSARDVRHDGDLCRAGGRVPGAARACAACACGCCINRNPGSRSRAGSAARPEVARVLHPALESDPGHAIWKRDFTGASSLFSIVFKPMPDAAAHAFINALTLFGIGASWGGFESLAIPFDCTPFRTATTWTPGGPAIRFHIGLEDVGDLTADLEKGFAAMRNVEGYTADGV